MELTDELVHILACIGIALNMVLIIDTYFWYKGKD